MIKKISRCFKISVCVMIAGCIQSTCIAQSIGDINGDGQVTLMGFGDSITAGIGDGAANSTDEILSIKGEGYLGRLNKNLGILTINAGNPGERSESGSYRFVKETQASRPDYIFIMEAANDAIDQVSLKEFRRSMQRMVNIGRRMGSEVRLMTPTTVHSFRSGQNLVLDAYSNVLYEIATANDVSIVPLREAYRRSCPSAEDECNLLHNDFLHPNQQGHNLIFEVAAASLFGIDLMSPEGPELLAQSLGVSVDDLTFR